MVQRFEAVKAAHLGDTVVRPAWRTIYSETTTISYLVLLLLTDTAKSGKQNYICINDNILLTHYTVLPEGTRRKITQVFEACR